MRLKILRITEKLKNLVIAIDGPAASGKSTTAKLVAEKLNYLYVDTGAMYRAMTFKVLKSGIDLTDEGEVARLASSTEIRLQRSGSQLRVMLDGKDVTTAIRRPEVTAAVSAVSAIRGVRDVMVREQREMGRDGGVVLEGRDIGTVVFPEADLKIFMVADVAQRAERRRIDLHGQGIEVDVAMLAQELLERDRKDTQRNISPLRKADNAFVLDTTNLTIEQQVETIIRHAHTLLTATP
jgi:cytidylate kinase